MLSEGRVTGGGGGGGEWGGVIKSNQRKNIGWGRGGVKINVE